MGIIKKIYLDLWNKNYEKKRREMKALIRKSEQDLHRRKYKPMK